MRAQFVVRNPKDVAREKLFNLEQTGSVREFTMHFRHLASQIGTMSDADLRTL